MNINAFTIYLWQLSGDVKGSTEGMAAFCFISLIITMLVRLIAHMHEEETPKLDRAIKPIVLIGLLSGVISTFLPTPNTIAMMVVIPKITESKVIQTDVPEIYNAAIKALKEQITTSPASK